MVAQDENKGGSIREKKGSRRVKGDKEAKQKEGMVTTMRKFIFKNINATL